MKESRRCGRRKGVGQAEKRNRVGAVSHFKIQLAVIKIKSMCKYIHSVMKYRAYPIMEKQKYFLYLFFLVEKTSFSILLLELGVPNQLEVLGFHSNIYG